MKPQWFRRPDGGLVAATHEDQVSLYAKRRNYRPVSAEDAEAEVRDRIHEAANERRRKADQEAKEAEIAAEREKAAERIRQANAGNSVGPPLHFEGAGAANLDESTEDGDDDAAE